MTNAHQGLPAIQPKIQSTPRLNPLLWIEAILDGMDAVAGNRPLPLRAVNALRDAAFWCWMYHSGPRCISDRWTWYAEEIVKRAMIIASLMIEALDKIDVSASNEGVRIPPYTRRRLESFLLHWASDELAFRLRRGPAPRPVDVCFPAVRACRVCGLTRHVEIIGYGAACASPRHQFREDLAAAKRCLREVKAILRERGFTDEQIRNFVTRKFVLRDIARGVYHYDIVRGMGEDVYVPA